MRSIFKYYLFCLLILLVSCGVKKPLSLEQYLEDGVTVDSVRMEKCSGHYSLESQYDSCGQLLNRKYVDADSLILTPDGHYYKYKNRKKVDHGTFIIRGGKPFHICVDFNSYDKEGNLTAISEPNNGIVEYSIPIGFADMIIDMCSYSGKIQSFWIRRFSDDGKGVHYRLVFVKDINTPGCHKVFRNSNVVTWI